MDIDLRRLFWRQWTLMGSTMGSRREYREIVRLAQEDLKQLAFEREASSASSFSGVGVSITHA